MTLDIEPSRLARWLTIALHHRTRLAEKLTKDFGQDSTGALEAKAECADINTYINICVKEAAAAPLKAPRK